ncbi:hypothetical protein FQN49_008152 [Arthroderma sp. PD_2]|nr:hypothetical protein FQN49_008152 [Arthroderma sp. PD_2]
MLALMHGALPQWKREKWSAVGTGDGYTVSLTLGNGSRHVMVILGNDLGFDMEILAAGNVRFRLSLWERIGLLMLAILWIGLLITIAGVSEGTWCLIGILHNLLVAGAPREPSASGFHLRHVDTFFANKVVKVLRKTEERYPLVGSSLIPIFFPAGLRIKDSESVFWEMANQRRKDLDLGQLHLRIDK